MKTVPNYEPFYNNLKDSNFVGKYRLFLIRNIKEDDITSRRYTNIGVYTGGNLKYLAGEEIKNFDPGDGVNRNFYVLNNSPSTVNYVDLILDRNIADTNVCFNSTNTSSIPNIVLDKLKEVTSSWTNVSFLTNYTYQLGDIYTINYNGYRARLLEVNDILNFLGCREDNETCFDYINSHEVTFDIENINYLTTNLESGKGYWTGIVVPNSNLYAWGIKYVTDTENTYGAISPIEINNCLDIGIRPIIRVYKDQLK